MTDLLWVVLALVGLVALLGLTRGLEQLQERK